MLGFAPFGVYPAPIFSLAALLHRLSRLRSARQAWWLGWGFGLGLFGCGIFWVRNSMLEFGGMGPELALPLTFGLAALLAVIPALVTWGSFRLAHRSVTGWALYGWFPLLWLAGEWLRGWLLGGFPWLSLGYSQIDAPWAGLAPLIGVLGLGALGVGMAALLAVLPGLKMRARRWVILSLVFLVGLGTLSGRLVWSRPAGPTLSVALVQANIAQSLKWRPERLPATLEYYRQRTLQYANNQLIVWPETAIPGTLEQVRDPWLEALINHPELHNRSLVMGAVTQNFTQQKYFNSIVLAGNGWPRYDKRHLVPFGEFTPLEFLLKPLIQAFAIPMSNFSVGVGDRPLLPIGDYWAGVSICFESAFPNEISEALPRAHYLINISNDAWFGDSLAPYQNLEIARMRALENARYLLRATNTGISAIINPQGQLMAEQPLMTEGVVTGSITPLTGVTPFSQWGDWPLSALWLLAVAGLTRQHRRRQDRSEA